MVVVESLDFFFATLDMGRHVVAVVILLALLARL